MRMQWAITCAILSVAANARAQTFNALPASSLRLYSMQSGATVLPGTPISWQITAFVESGTNLGLAGFTVDLVQSSGNPSRINVLPATEVPATLTNFSRPQGISNPQVGDPAASAYTGTPVGPGSGRDLLEIGGILNTFGVQGAHVGHHYILSASDEHVAQTGEELVAQGSFNAPASAGSYLVYLANGQATVLISRGSQGQHSAVCAASLTLLDFITFTVSNCCSQDFDGDGDVATDADIEAFFHCLAGDCCPMCGSADYNCDGDVATDADIEAFFRVLAGGPC